jgi:hypothetical protein
MCPGIWFSKGCSSAQAPRLSKLPLTSVSRLLLALLAASRGFGAGFFTGQELERPAGSAYAPTPHSALRRFRAEISRPKPSGKLNGSLLMGRKRF